MEVTALQWIVRLALFGCLLWSIWMQSWFYVAGNIIFLVISARDWQSHQK